MINDVRIYALGGLDTNGKNLYCVEINGDIIVICCGVGYPDKTAPGIDFIIPNFTYLKENKSRVKAYILPDAHDDSLGALPFIYNEVPAPIYTGNFTALFLNKFTEDLNMKINYKINELFLPSSLDVSGHKITFFRTCFSSPDSFGVIIDTPYGNVVYSGDSVFDFSENDRFKLDLNALTHYGKKKTLALLCDSINAGRKGFTSPSHRLKDLVNKDICDAEGKVFISLYNQHVFNYLEIIDIIINQTQRLICFYDAESENVFKALIASKVVKIPSNRLLLLEDLPRTPDKNVTIIMSGNGDKLYNKISLLALKDVDDKRIILKENDTFIIACPAAPNFEVLATDVLDELFRVNCKVVNISRKQLISMHGSEDDIKMLISCIKPMYYIPIKGEYRDLMSNANLAVSMNIGLNHMNVFLIDNGDLIDFYDETKAPKFVDLKLETDIGTMMVDGIGVGDVANEIIQERTRLSEDGVVILSCVVNGTSRKIMSAPDVQMRGYLFVKDSEAIIKGLTNILVSTINKHLEGGNRFNKQQCEKEIKDECVKYTRRLTQRNPIIDPTITVL